MPKPATGPVSFDDDERDSGVFIRKDDTSEYARAITGVLKTLENHPTAANELGLFELVALKNLGSLLKACSSGEGLCPKLDLRSLKECLKSR